MLTEKEIQNGKAKGMAAKPQGKAYKLADGQGLYLCVRDRREVLALRLQARGQALHPDPWPLSRGGEW